MKIHLSRNSFSNGWSVIIIELNHRKLGEKLFYISGQQFKANFSHELIHMICMYMSLFYLHNFRYLTNTYDVFRAFITVGMLLMGIWWRCILKCWSTACNQKAKVVGLRNWMRHIKTNYSLFLIAESYLFGSLQYSVISTTFFQPNNKPKWWRSCRRFVTLCPFISYIYISLLYFY